MCCWYAHCFYYMYIQILLPHLTFMNIRAFPWCGDFQCFHFPMQNANSSLCVQLYSTSLTLLCSMIMILLVLPPLPDCKCLRAPFQTSLSSDTEERQLCCKGTAMNCLSSNCCHQPRWPQGGHVEKVSFLFTALALSSLQHHLCKAVMFSIFLWELERS